MEPTMPFDRTTRIRSIFLARKRSYTLADLRRLTGISEHKVLRGIKAGEYLATRRRGEYRFKWSELALIAMAKWPLTAIHSALGADAPQALPPLLLLQELNLHLPAYQVLMVHRLAERRSLDVDSYLADYFLDLAGSEAPTLDAEIPGFAAAMRFPNGK